MDWIALLAALTDRCNRFRQSLGTEGPRDVATAVGARREVGSTARARARDRKWRLLPLIRLVHTRKTMQRR